MKLNRAQVFALAVTAVIVVTAAPSCAHGQVARPTPARPTQVTQAPTTLVGNWRADTPLPTGAVQTFRFAADGSFELVVAVAVDGQYRVEGNKLIETVTVPATGMAGTDTAAVFLRGDSLVLGDAASPGAKTLHRPASVTTSTRTSATTSAGKGIIGDWVIMLPNGLAASYHFDPDGTSHIRAQVSDERGNYTVKGNTLRLTSERTFQLPATTTFSVSDSVLTLTPANGHGARGFRRISPR